MRVLFDINHPAHVHFFKNPLRQLIAMGAEVTVTSRLKECATDLLDELNISHTVLSAHTGRQAPGLLKELLCRDYALWQAARAFKPDVMASIGGTFISHVGRMRGIPSVVFYDTENARLQNAITYPLATQVVVPRCYKGWVPKRKRRTYPGYHELAYLHPNYFSPDREIALQNGLGPDCDNFLVRVVSWRANHDLGESGWSESTLRQIVDSLSKLGKVIISAESDLPADLEKYRYTGSAGNLHHVMSFCRMLIAESATMASESAVLGVPAIYAATTGRGYTDEQEIRYGLVRNIRSTEFQAIQEAAVAMLQQPTQHWLEAREKLLDETIDVTAYIVQTLSEVTEHFSTRHAKDGVS